MVRDSILKAAIVSFLLNGRLLPFYDRDCRNEFSLPHFQVLYTRSTLLRPPKLTIMQTKSGWKYILPAMIAVMVAALAVTVSVKYHPGTSDNGLAPLPPDVHGVMNDYLYRETSGGVTIEVQGKRLVQRGRRVLGVRSNLAKTTYLDSLRGSYRSASGSLRFAARTAEWDLLPRTPLVLREGVELSVGKRDFAGVRRANVWLDKGIVEIYTDRKQIVSFK
jgi:hypothetical protein